MFQLKMHSEALVVLFAKRACTYLSRSHDHVGVFTLTFRVQLICFLDLPLYMHNRVHLHVDDVCEVVVEIYTLEVKIKSL